MIRKQVVLFLLILNCLDLIGQDIRVNYQATDRALIQVLKDLEKDHNVHFAFSPKQLKGKRVTIEAQNQDLDEFLRQMLRPLQLEHTRVETEFISVTTPESVFLRAQIVDGESGESLPFASVRLKDTYNGSVADVDGNLNLVIDEPLGAVLQFSFIGYETFEMNMEGYENKDRIKIELSPETQELQEYVIREYLNNGITTDDRASKITIKPQEMEILPGLSERDILLSAQILAGINSNDESASGMNVRGSSRDNTFIYWNNIPIYQPAHYFGNISAFIPSTVREVDIYKNHIPVKYSGASSALVLVKSGRERVEKPEFETNLNLTHLDFYGKVPFLKDQGSIMFGARRSFNDLIETPTFTALSNKLFEGSITQDIQQSIDEEFRYNSKLTFSDFNLKWIYEPSGKNRFSLSAIRSGSVLDYNSVDEFEVFESVQNHEVTNFGLNIQWDHRWGERLQTNLSASYSAYNMDYSLVEFREVGEDDDDRESRTNELRNLEIRLSNDYAIAKDHVLNFGYQMNLMDATLLIDEDLFFEEDETDNIASRGFIHGAFVDYTGKFSPKFQIGLGMRANYYETAATTVFDPQLRLTYEVNKNWLLKSSIGKYTQYLSAIQDADFTFSNTVEQHWVLADEEETVPLITNFQTVLGFLYDKNGWLVDFDVYYKFVDGIMAQNFGPSFNVGEGNEPGDEGILGIDLILKKKWKNYRAWLSYGFQDSRANLFIYEEDGFPILEAENFTSGLNIRHQLQFSQTLNMNQFEFSLGYTAKSGLPFTGATNLILVTEPEEDEDPEEFEPYYIIEYGESNTSRLSWYHRVDLSVWYKFPRIKSSKIRGEVGLSILNVLNRRNVLNRTIDFDFDENDNITLIQREKYLLGITPNISLRLKF